MSDRISVIIPCYNVGRRVNECLDSLIHQSYGVDNLELILVDDASEDDTVSILRSYEEKYPEQIMLVLCEKNGRQGTARNIGMSYASGEWISFVDADDKVHERMFELLMSVAEKTDAEMITFRYSTDPQILDWVPETEVSDFEVICPKTSEERRSFVLRYDLINNSCTQKLYRRSWLKNTGVMFAQGVCYEEPLFAYPLRYCVNRLIVTEWPLYFYHLNEMGTTNMTMSDPNTIRDHLSVQSQLLAFMRKYDFYEEYRNEIELNFLHCFVYEPYTFLSGRGYEMPKGIAVKIADIASREIPEWQSNPYLSQIPDEERELIIQCMRQCT